jgi:hypothetical protein
VQVEKKGPLTLTINVVATIHSKNAQIRTLVSVKSVIYIMTLAPNNYLSQRSDDIENAIHRQSE